MQHYYSENPDIKTNRRNMLYSIGNKEIEIYTDNGVFSKNKVDYGTDIMLNTFISHNNDKLMKKNILDIGCGYGIVGLILKLTYSYINITLSDINNRALELSKLNFEKYNLEANILHSNLFENISDKFDIILSNPPIRTGKQNVFKIYEEAYNHLNTNGEFYCVIQTKQGAKSTEKKLNELFGNCKTLNISNGYRIYLSKKE